MMYKRNDIIVGISRIVASLGTAQGKKNLAIFLGALILAVASLVSTTGLRWSLHYHPDEQRVADWIDEVRDDGYIQSRVYPSGWFELFRVKLWFEDWCKKRAGKWQRHSVQDGMVEALSDKSLAPGFGYKYEGDRRHVIQDGRNYNAFLHILATLLIYGACLEAGFHPLASLISTLFFLFNANALEFMHYCETDEALVFSFAFFAWIAARALRKQSSVLAVAAAFSAGFAVSCKFTLVPVLLWVLTAPVAVLWPKQGTRLPSIWQVALLVFACVIAACYGYVTGTPAIVKATDWYFEALEGVKQATYSEILANLGGNTSKTAANTFRAICLNEILGSGLLIYTYGIIAWTFWFRKDFRRQLAGLPMLLPVFIPFLIFMCPFVRRQETLPIGILLAFSAGLPFEFIMRKDDNYCMFRKTILRRAACIATIAIGLLALIDSIIRAMFVNDCFHVRDTRAEAQNWLSSSMPENTPIAFDSYVAQVARGVDCEALHLGGLPYRWKGIPLSLRDGKPLDYYVENVGFYGRLAIREPETGRIKEGVLKNMSQYNESSFPLKAWRVAESAPRPTFIQQTVKLVGFVKPQPGDLDISLGYARPILLLPDGARLYDSLEASGLGANRAVHTVGKRTQIAASSGVNPRWLITRMLDGDKSVRIIWEGMAETTSEILHPGETIAARLSLRPLAKFFSRARAYPTLKCRMRGDDQNVVCGSYFAQSIADAARELNCGGTPRKALELLLKEKTLTEPAKVEAFLAAMDTSGESCYEWIEAARSALRACDIWRDNPTEKKVSLCGTPLLYCNDFARVKVRDFVCAPGCRVPVFFPPGRYGITLRIDPASAPDPIPSILFLEQRKPFNLSQDESGRFILSQEMDFPEGTMLHASGTINDLSFVPFPCDFIATWSPREHTLQRANKLREALDRGKSK